jgi:hypothetical protein
LGLRRPNRCGYNLNSHERNDLQLAREHGAEKTYSYTQEEEEEDQAAKDQAQSVRVRLNRLNGCSIWI